VILGYDSKTRHFGMAQIILFFVGSLEAAMAQAIRLLLEKHCGIA
jgi:hypothetical protein